jgi:hypothetical protein
MTKMSRVAASPAARAAWLALGALLGAGGCVTAGSNTLLRGSHPSRLAALEAPATVRQGSIAFAAAGGGEIAHHGGFESRDVRSTKGGGGARVRIGAIEGMELQMEGAAVRWRTSAPACAGDPVGQVIDDGIFMGRGGFKFSPAATRRVLAFTTGIGGGRGPTGSYLAPDLGLSLGLEGGPVVPFMHLEIVGSFPMSRTTVTALLCRTNTHRVESTYEAHNNVMGRATFGLKVPLPEVRRRRLYSNVNLYFAGLVSVTPTITGGAVAGAEVVFGPRSATGR